MINMFRGGNRWAWNLSTQQLWEASRGNPKYLKKNLCNDIFSIKYFTQRFLILKLGLHG
jgi:hypothetical protein